MDEIHRYCHTDLFPDPIDTHIHIFESKTSKTHEKHVPVMENHVLLHFNQFFHFFDFHDFPRIFHGFSGVDTTKVILKIPKKMEKKS